MQTKRWQLNDTAEEITPDLTAIIEAANLLKQNEVVAFPTETVYGLGGNALSDKAIHKIFEAKGRPGDNPLIVHIAEENQIHDLCQRVTPAAEKMIRAFWPGPLTIILPSNGRVSAKVTAGLDTVAVRMPSHPVALALIKACGLPVAAPSANTSGRPSPTTASHVISDLDGRIAGVVDGGQTGVGVESTVVDATSLPVTILRPGGISHEALESVLGEVAIDPALQSTKDKPKAPGMKYTHYAPKAPLYLVNGGTAAINQAIQSTHEKGEKAGVIIVEEHKEEVVGADILRTCGSLIDPASIARNLYDVLRAFDHVEVDAIFCETIPEKGIGEAVMNRLRKAAGGRIL